MENESIGELLEKLRAARSARELAEMAKAEGAEIAPDKAEELFARLNAEGEISEEEELDTVAGGMLIKRSNVNAMEAMANVNVNTRELIERMMQSEGNRQAVPLDLPISRLS